MQSAGACLKKFLSIVTIEVQTMILVRFHTFCVGTILLILKILILINH